MDFALILGMRIKWESCCSFSHVNHSVTHRMATAFWAAQADSEMWAQHLGSFPEFCHQQVWIKGQQESFYEITWESVIYTGVGYSPNLEEWVSGGMGAVKLNWGLAHWYFHFLFIWSVRYFSFFLFKWRKSLFFEGSSILVYCCITNHINVIDKRAIYLLMVLRVSNLGWA